MLVPLAVQTNAASAIRSGEVFITLKVQLYYRQRLCILRKATVVWQHYHISQLSKLEHETWWCLGSAGHSTSVLSPVKHYPLILLVHFWDTHRLSADKHYESFHTNDLFLTLLPTISICTQNQPGWKRQLTHAGFAWATLYWLIETSPAHLYQSGDLGSLFKNTCMASPAKIRPKLIYIANFILHFTSMTSNSPHHVFSLSSLSFFLIFFISNQAESWRLNEPLRQKNAEKKLISN